MSWEFSTGPVGPERGVPHAAAHAPFIDIKRLFQLRTPLMVAVFFLLAIPGLIAAWYLSPGKYTATAELRFLATTPRVMEVQRGGRETPYATFLRTQINVITGNSILAEVLERPSVRNLPGLSELEAPLEALKTVVTAEVQRSSELVTVSCSTRDRESAETILSEVIDVYLEFALKEEATTGGERLNILVKERDAKQTELDLLLARIADLQSQMSVPAAGGAILQSDEADLYRENLVREELRLAEANALIEELTASIDSVKEYEKQSPNEPAFLFGVEDRVNADPRVVGLRNELASAEAEFALRSAQLAPQAPQRRIAQRNVSSLQASLARIERQARTSALRAVRAEFEHKHEATRVEAEEAAAQVSRFTSLLAEYDQHVQDAAKELAEIEKLKTQADEVQSLLRNIRREITEISLESNAPARVKLASPVYVSPGGPSHSKRKKLMLLVLIAAGGTSLGLGILLERTDQRVLSPLDISMVTEMPILAAIPHASEDRMANSDQIHSLTVDCPNSTSADEFRRVLSRILYPSHDFAKMGTVLVTSPIQGDGKTVVACNLANALAEANRRVLLVDLSVRRPNIEARFKMEPAAGLSEVVLDGESPETLVRSQSSDNVWILGPGMNPDELVGKLGSGEMVRFLEKAEQEFDHVIIDTPPLLLFSDAQLLAPLVNGVVVVAGVGISNMGMIKRCLSELKQVRANVLGIVLNGLRGTPGGYLHRNLQLHYDAFSEREGGAFARKMIEVDPKDSAEPPRETPSA
ncbi:MAG: AAA family ATPase [Nitrospiraceae bacterium]|nr:AAA family ATPase [Nitrospiraceae bacterium]